MVNEEDEIKEPPAVFVTSASAATIQSTMGAPFLARILREKWGF
jgi:hypothetical protein